MITLPAIPPVCRDPADDKVLATALWGRVDYLITADGDLTTPAVAQMLRSEGILISTIDGLIIELDKRASWDDLRSRL